LRAQKNKNRNHSKEKSKDDIQGAIAHRHPQFRQNKINHRRKKLLLRRTLASVQDRRGNYGLKGGGSEGDIAPKETQGK